MRSVLTSFADINEYFTRPHTFFSRHIPQKHWSAFDVSRSKSSNHFALFTFSGPAFQQGIIPQSCTLSTLTYFAKHLYILDPVYGVLRSTERIQPYRLEMGCKGVINEGASTKKESLASFWKDSVTAYIGNQLTSASSVDGGPILVNLASEEYSSSIDIPSLPGNTIFLNVLFRHKGRVVSVHAKRARGLMARYLAERDAKSLSDVSEFGLEGYRCTPVNESGVERNRLWETVDVVGDNIRVVQMLFDRDDVPGTSSMAQTKRKDEKTVGKSKKRSRNK